MMTEPQYIKMVKTLAINELELCGDLSTELNAEDVEDINTLNQYNGIQDIELTIRDICNRHQAYKTIEELKKEDADASQKELIECLKHDYRHINNRHLCTVARCSNNSEKLIQILKDNYYWIH